MPAEDYPSRRRPAEARAGATGAHRRFRQPAGGGDRRGVV